MKNYINEFIEDLKLAGRSEGTLREYRARLIEIADYFSENNIKIEEVTNADIKGFLNFLLKKNRAWFVFFIITLYSFLGFFLGFIIWEYFLK